MKRCHTQFFVACLLATLAGCSWESALYEEFVGNNDRVISCAGECLNGQGLNQSECKGDGLTWNEGHCSGLSADVSIDDVKDQMDCSAHNGTWQDAYCEATTKYGCYQLNGEWRTYEFKVLDLGDGRYIRELDNGFFCGNYEEILQANDAKGCNNNEIKRFKSAQENHICPSMAQNCMYFPPTIKPDESDDIKSVEAMCSSCAEGMAVCYENNKFQCVDLNSNSNHCGVCGNKCKSTDKDIQRCDNGICKVDSCDPPKLRCANNTCVDPTDAKTCGMTCDKEGAVCQYGNTCVHDGSKYKCDCESGIYVDGNKRCVNPSSNDTCGASEDTPSGTTCGKGQSCQRGEDGKYACKCTNPTELTCTNAEGQPYCVDTYADKYCGATSCDTLEEAGCSASQQCQQGKCVCKPEFVNCGGSCIDPDQSSQHCGAKGSCTIKDDPLSDNYSGDSCDSSKVCSHGKCICNSDAGYFEYRQDNKLNCVLPSDKLYCGISSNDNINNEMDECMNHEECVLSNGKYKCECEKGYTSCGGDCIDLMRDSNYCSSTGKCEDAENCNESGKVCVAGKCDTSCPSGQALCDGKCVDKDEFHVNDDCTACDEFHCYMGEKGKPFNYLYCRENLDHQLKNNVLGSGEFCGETCEKAKSCGKNQICDASTYQCACPAGYIECSNENGDYYCADLNSDIENCGKCGNTCVDKFINVKGLTCNNGRCGYRECINQDYAIGEKTCNDNPNVGCMINLLSDDNNCGSCGTICPLFTTCKTKCCHLDYMVTFSPINREDCCAQSSSVTHIPFSAIYFCAPN